MKVWLWAAAIMAAIWSGIWFVGAAATERVIGAWLSDRQAEGWVVNYQTLNTSGYPIRFNTALSGIDLADPETGLAWTAPDFLLAQPSYNPHAIRVTWPAEQTIASPHERLVVRSAEMVAELEVEPGTDLALERSATRMRRVEVVSSLGWDLALEAATLDVARRDSGENRYAIAFDAASLTPPEAVRDRLDPAGVLPRAIGSMRIEAVMGFDRPWDISALETARPGITHLDLGELHADWGDLVLRAAGTLAVDPRGYPTGDIAVRAENWREMIVLASNAGAIPEGMRGTLETALGFLSGLSGRPEDIEAQLAFRDERVFFGPIPIGPAPRLILR